jgi:hypothetical protein
MKRKVIHVSTGRLPDSTCPFCTRLLSAATGVSLDDEPPIPTPGCVTFCGYCGEMLTFADDLTLRVPTPDEAEAFANDQSPTMKLIRKFIENVKKQRIVGEGKAEG